MGEFPNWMISVDDHVLEPGHLWQERVPAKLRDRAPRLVETDQGTIWEFDGQAWTHDGMKPHPTPRALATEEVPGVVA